MFILGAGFSKAIDSRMPTSDELGEEVKALLEENGRPLPAELTKGTFEEWLSRLAEDQPDLLEHENLRRRAWFSEISQAVADVLINVPEGKAKSHDEPPWLRSFIGAAHGWRATVITFNYDTLLEGGVNGSSFHDFDVYTNNLVRSCDVLRHLPPYRDDAEKGPYSTFRLLKLHGSVNFYRTSGDKVGTSLVRWPLAGETHIPPRSQDDVFKDSLRDNIFGRRTYSPPGKMETSAESKRRALLGFEPFIVPPVALKSPYYGLTFLQDLWREARKAIAAASHVYLVGYSLPETDLVTVGLMRESLAPDARVFVVNRPGKGAGEDVVARAERLLVRDVEAVHPESYEAVKLWAAEMAEERSREVPGDLLVKFEAEFNKNGNQYQAHVTVYPDDGRDPWCMEESAAGQELTCVAAARYSTGLKNEPTWQPEKLIETIKDLATSGASFAITGPDGDEHFVIDAHVNEPSGPAYHYEVHLQSTHS